MPGIFRKLVSRFRGGWPYQYSSRLEQFFDRDFYLNRYPDVAESGTDPLTHYMTHGWREGRDPCPDFSTRHYGAANGLTGKNPFLHWVTKGREQGLPGRPAADDLPLSEIAYAQLKKSDRKKLKSAFDPDYYLRRNPDVAEAGVDPFDHYMVNGWQEGRDPSPDFSTWFYRETNEDVAKAGLNPFQHFILHGQAEGRPGIGPDAFRSAWDFAERALNLSRAEFDRVESAFDEAYYLGRNADIRTTQTDPLLHFLLIGWRERRNPRPDFDINYYFEENKDISSSRNPFLHWVLHGRAEGRLGCQPGEEGAAQERLLNPDEIDWSACNKADIEVISDRFDTDFYLNSHPEVADLGVDPRVHYLMLGWKLGYDPSPGFSTAYYQERYIDIRRAGANPFVHYCRHGYLEQRETRSHIARLSEDFRPLVSVIIPNYNHAAFLPERIRSIAEQTYDNFELIILDDVSTDNSREVIRQTVQDLGLDARLEFNETNSGNVFAQWQKGLSLARGDLIWICESDDFCEPDFLEHLVPAFTDDSVNIAFGRIQFADAEGAFMNGLDAYRERTEPWIWQETLTRPAAEWFSNAFGVRNVIANVGGCVFRRMDLPDAVWDEARTYKIAGDWFLYLHIAGAGQLTYEPRSVAYFRQHGSNTSASNFHQRYYYDENMRVLRLLAETWGIPQRTREHFLNEVRRQYNHLGMAEKLGDFDETFETAALLSLPKTTFHLQICFLGFYAGGGELFPINLANAFVRAGYTVSMLAVDMGNINEDMRARLDARIPVYHASHLTSRGRKAFFDACGVDLINSHVATADAFLYTLGTSPIERPYVVTLHGSYVAFDKAAAELVDWVTGNVSQWIYTADRNLEFFENRAVDWDEFVKLPNAMPIDPRPATFTREDLSIAPTDTVFTLVARGIKRKGWRAAVESFRHLCEDRGRDDVHLLLVGDGEEADRAKSLAKGLDRIHFLGYQSEINGMLRLTDCMILPTRFEGESYPLILIQALQEHVPVIATDIGEIRAMMTTESGEAAGILLRNQRDSRAFFADLTDAMEQMTDPDQRQAFAAVATECAKIYDIDALVGSYMEVFGAARDQFEASNGPETAQLSGA